MAGKRGFAVVVGDRQPEVTTVVETIDPKIANDYLETIFKSPDQTVRNRQLSDTRVNLYAEAMKRGEWKIINNGIAFDWNGILRDGQHRLFAIIETNCAVQMNVTRGMDPDAFDVIDTGRIRSGADVLYIHGEKNAKNLRAAITWQFIYETRGLGHSNPKGLTQPTHPEVLDILSRNGTIRDSVNIVNHFDKGYRRIMQPGLMIWLHYHFSQLNPIRCQVFFDDLAHGGAEVGSPMHVLRERLLKNMVDNRKLSPNEVAAYAVKTWNLITLGQSKRVLTWREDESFPVALR